MPMHYAATVWNLFDGDVIKKEWDCDEAMLQSMEEEAEENGYEVVIDDFWEDEE